MNTKMTEDEQKFYDACAIAATGFDIIDHEKAAYYCFNVADAMLAERRKRINLAG